MQIPKLWLLTALAALAAATPLAALEYAVKETHPVPEAWTRVGPAPADYYMRVDIALKQPQFSELERHLYEGTC
jgi:tripeptidyl-peptidase-1